MNFKTLIPTTLGALTLLSSPMVSAADVSYGVQAGLAKPFGDVRDFVDKTGFTVGGFAQFDLGNGHNIRARIDTFQTKQTQSEDFSVPGMAITGSVSDSRKVSCLAIGADYVRYVRRDQDKGLYLLAGLGLSSNLLSNDLAIQLPLDPANVTRIGISQTPKSTQLYLNLGLGYQFNAHFGLEAGYRVTAAGNHEHTPTVSLSGLPAGAPANLESTINASIPPVHMDMKGVGFFSVSLVARF
jgi:hypothetical protein